MAALREIYDGRWVRDVGTDGGRTLDWHGRIAVIGAVTTAWDAAHAVIAKMGDRFVLLRMDSTTERIQRGAAGYRQHRQRGEDARRAGAAVADVLAGASRSGIELNDEETGTLLAAADLVTLARTGVEFDYRGDVIDAHAPEMPTRFAKQLAQIVRGGVAVGMRREDAMRLAIRCARDSMPPIRLAILDYLAGHPNSFTTEVRKGSISRTPPSTGSCRRCTCSGRWGVWRWRSEQTNYGGTTHCAKALTQPPCLSQKYQ